ncbi:transposase, MuDR, MULE transposase domain protein [Artemisia annua]|uniref:Transposase, MuDR, MULE transposase domain protein n=1 Tax=Artemisia annua TaxID=35608 RepID=A0A2U1L6V5_ARTAN|nr:transposase, MuDR, MULE transposase domain protein [Artemisia annua]
MKLHYGGRFTECPNRKYVEGEVTFVDMIDMQQFNIDLLYSVLNSLGYDSSGTLYFHYKIPLKWLDKFLKPLVNESDFEGMLEYVPKHKTMYVYVENGNTTIGTGELIDTIKPNVTLSETDLHELDFESCPSDNENDSARTQGLRKLRKGIKNSFFVGKEFANQQEAKDRIRAYAVEARRNIEFKKNDKLRLRVICKGVVPSVNNKDAFVDKVQSQTDHKSDKGKKVIEHEENDKVECPWILYISKGDKGKWVVKTFIDEHKCLQSRKIKHCTSTFLSKHITDIITNNPEIPILAVQEQLQKKFHVGVSRTKAFRAKAKAQKIMKGDAQNQYALLRDYVIELQRCNPDTTVKIDVYREEDPEINTRIFRRIYVCLGALKKGTYILVELVWAVASTATHHSPPSLTTLGGPTDLHSDPRVKASGPF